MKYRIAMSILAVIVMVIVADINGVFDGVAATSKQPTVSAPASDSNISNMKME